MVHFGLQNILATISQNNYITRSHLQSVFKYNYGLLHKYVNFTYLLFYKFILEISFEHIMTHKSNTNIHSNRSAHLNSLLRKITYTKWLTCADLQYRIAQNPLNEKLQALRRGLQSYSLA